MTSTAIRNERAIEVTAIFISEFKSPTLFSDTWLDCRGEYILNTGLLVATFKIILLLSLLVVTIWNPLRLKFAS
ncbi:hypothetical protein CEXT_287491 [Caerostris extrusa]|uniref:Uncharacterized protein n=1 Tax=Caerostris extrusa TaxID=172846 RepID=A0AAV4N694_CAEEX|nr:hypothetical protein CEXT_287491 [Caerostris extrusa]